MSTSNKLLYRTYMRVHTKYYELSNLFAIISTTDDVLNLLRIGIVRTKDHNLQTAYCLLFTVYHLLSSIPIPIFPMTILLSQTSWLHVAHAEGSSRASLYFC